MLESFNLVEQIYRNLITSKILFNILIGCVENHLSQTVQDDIMYAFYLCLQ
jgi:hypothetical protein